LRKVIHAQENLLLLLLSLDKEELEVEWSTRAKVGTI